MGVLRTHLTTLCCLVWTWVMMSAIPPVLCQECESDISFTINPDAGVKFTVITSLSKPNGNTCGEKMTSSLQNVAVIQWIVDKMNNANFTKDVKIGFDVYDDCHVVQKTMSHALHVLDGPILGSPSCGRNSTCNIGILGTSSSRGSESLLYAIGESGPPVLGPYASFPDLTRYINFYRSIPNDDQHIKAVLDVLKQLELTYVAVVTTDNQYGRYSARKLQDIGKQHGVCVDVIHTLQLGRDINKTQLIEQRQKTKDNSLRVVYFGSRDIYRLMMRELEHSASEVSGISWLFVERAEDFSPPLDAQSDKIINGTIIVRNSQMRIEEAVTYVNKKWEKVLTGDVPSDTIEELIHCLPETYVPPWYDVNTVATIDAVFVLLGAFQRQLMVLCPDGNGDSDAVCEQIRKNFDFNLHREVLLHPTMYRDVTVRVDELAEANRVVNFTTDGNVLLDAASPLYDVILVSENRFEKVGVFRDNKVHFNVTGNFTDMGKIGSSRCGESCPVCEEFPDIPFMFLEGDTYILGIGSVHETDPDHPFQCSQLRLSQMDVIVNEAILHTVESMRAETGIKYGVILLDDCYSSARIELTLTQIMSRKTVLVNPYTGEPLDVSKIGAVVSTAGSTVTIPVTLLMTEFNIPVISSAATSPDLDDRNNFPYFLRTVPSDVKQAEAMISIIQHMKWKYISVMYVNNNYGTRGKNLITKLAAERGICVAETPEGIADVVDDNTSDLMEVATRISNQETDVVVYFGTGTMFEQFIKASPPGKYVFLGSEDWGARQYILDIGNTTLGSLLMTNEVTILRDDSLISHFRNANPSSINHQRNPWFAKFWEELFQCDLAESFANKYDRRCNETHAFDDVTLNEMKTDQRILHTIEAVRVAAVGMKQARDKYCLFDKSFPCRSYFVQIKGVVETIRSVTLARAGVEERVFGDDGNGNVGFIVNNVQRANDGKLFYKEVGSYDNDHLNLQVHALKFYRADMDGACVGSKCDHCATGNIPTTTTIATTAATSAELYSISDFTLIGIMGLIVLIILISSIIIVCYFKRRVTDLENHLKETRYDLRTGAYIASQTGVSNTGTYPEMRFANTGPSGETLYEFKKAQNVLNGGSGTDGRMLNGGVVNRAFEHGEMYIHPRHSSDERDVSTSSAGGVGKPRIKTSPRRSKSSVDQSSSNSVPDSPQYKPSSPSYGLTSASSFKRPDNPHNNHNTQIKLQPRTQLAVPPCRPELPPRDSGQSKPLQRPESAFPEQFENTPSAAVPKDKARHTGRSNHKRTVSPPSYNKYQPSTEELPPYRERQSGVKDTAPPLSNGFNFDSSRSTQDAIQFSGSIEKISRV